MTATSTSVPSWLSLDWWTPELRTCGLPSSGLVDSRAPDLWTPELNRLVRRTHFGPILVVNTRKKKWGQRNYKSDCSAENALLIID